MGSSNSERSLPKFSSFVEKGLNELQKVLTDLENSMKIEIGNLERDRCSMKREIDLMERAQRSLEQENLKLKEESWRSRRECYELREKITRLTEDQRVSNERERRKDEMNAKVSDELKTSQKLCDELKEKITRLLEDQRVLSEREKRANERSDEIYDEHSKQIDGKNKMIFQMNEKIKELKNEKLGIEQSLTLYKEKIKSLDLSAVELNEELEMLKCEKLEANQTVEESRKRVEFLTVRVENAEKNLAEILKVDIDNLQTLAKDKEKYVAALKNAYNFWNFEGQMKNSGNGTKWNGGNADFGNSNLKHCERSLNNGVAGDRSPMIHSAGKSSGSRIDGLSARDRHLEFSQSSRERIPTLRSGEIVEIVDSDDEPISQLYNRSPFKKSNEKNRANYREASLTNLMTKRKRSTYVSGDEEFPVGSRQEKQARD